MTEAQPAAMVAEAPLMTRPQYADNERPPLLAAVPADARRVLDIGCNQGAFGAALKRRGPVEVWGVEPDAAACAIARTRLDHVVNDLFHAGNPLPDAHFDLVTFNDSLEHMPDPAAALAACRRLLAPGGRVHCCVPNVRHIENVEHLLFDEDWAYGDSGVRDRTHLRFFTQKSIVRLFQQAGYDVVSAQGINESWWFADKRWRRLAFRLLPGLTDGMRYVNILVTARLRAGPA